jgi:hypothetical protein
MASADLRAARQPDDGKADRGTTRTPYPTVARFLQRAGSGRLKPVTPSEPVKRYERAQPGELLHIDVRKLGRIGRVGHRIHGDRTTRVRGVGKPKKVKKSK